MDILLRVWHIFLFEEILFFLSLAFWAYIRAHQPDIHGLEKYMDFGFVNSILRSEYFPPKDMWLTPFPINYYYFGHLVTAILTKLAFLPSAITYNLMIATIFSFSVMGSFSLGANLIYRFLTPAHPTEKEQKLSTANKIRVGLAGLLSGFLVSFAGNLHAMYLFYKPYQNENPQPFWQLAFYPETFPNNYWYPNATRFIYNTIHEFPLYSFVVSDLHGHVLDIPFVLLTLAIIMSIFFQKKITFSYIVFLGFLLAIMYTTNAWDGLIYFGLTAFACIAIWLFTGKKDTRKNIHTNIWQSVWRGTSPFTVPHLIGVLLLIGAFFIAFVFPFSLFFKPFVSGIGIVCAPEFLIRLGSLGPFIFEVNHCQQSPIWQLIILHGFFYFWVFLFFVIIWRQEKVTTSDLFVLLLIIISTLLIFTPEFLYAKDIYPAHYRANTMFKLVYQAFIMLSLATTFIIFRSLFFLRTQFVYKTGKLFLLFFSFGILLLVIVSLYPYFAIMSYYANVEKYHGLDGTTYLATLYPTDTAAIQWLNNTVDKQPVVLEAQGDSYTDYARVSVHTGLPTILGWTVHEWLWRGSYDIPSPRIEEVKTMYESPDTTKVKALLKKYHVSYIFLGELERQKYPLLREERLAEIANPVYKKGNTIIYKVK